MSWITSPEAWVGLLTLTVLEIVLGIDNIIFISILAGKLPQAQQGRARRIGLAGALVTRVALLATLAWIIRLTVPLFHVLGHSVSFRDLILIAGGLFLMAKSTREIHDALEAEADHAGTKVRASLAGVVGQIMVIDLVFSIDSIITAVGMARHLPVMIAAVVLAVGVMMFAATSISDFVHRHPTIKMLALSFLLLIGVSLIADGLGQHISRGYIYFAMGFSVFVELLNLRIRARTPPVKLREAYEGSIDTRGEGA